MSALDKVISFAAGSPTVLTVPWPEDQVSELILAAELAAKQLSVLLADAEDEKDGGDDEAAEGEGKGGGSHSGHPTYKKLVGKGMNPKMASSMCAKADNKVAASALAESLEVILSGLADQAIMLSAPAGESAEERRESASKGHALSDGSYPIPDKKHLHSAAVLAASKHGNWKAAQALIRKRARELGVDLSSLPGFGSGGKKDEKVAATAMDELVHLTGLPEDHAIEFLGLARKAAVPLQAFNHGTHSGTHSHGHLTMGIHEHDHSHNRDSMHDRHSHGSGDEGDSGGFGDF
jgi:pyruvate/2-oxoglutarate dehydrogenase complex dihydrolipoamide acyltransferase (E2) component